MEEKYSERCLYKDVYIIINMMDKDMKNKINPRFIRFLKENQDKEYVSCIDNTKPLKEQQIREEIKILLSIIYINYLCDKEEKAIILREEKQNITKYENNLYEVLKSRKSKQIENEKKELMVIKQENFMQRIINGLKKVLNVKKGRRMADESYIKSRHKRGRKER